MVRFALGGGRQTARVAVINPDPFSGFGGDTDEYEELDNGVPPLVNYETDSDEDERWPKPGPSKKSRSRARQAVAKALLAEATPAAPVA